MSLDISIVASAVRPKYWGQFLKSLQGNKCSYEVIFVGPVSPYIQEGCNDKLIWIESHACPAECYAIGFREASGTLIHWSADDAEYLPFSLDAIINAVDGSKKIIYEPLLYENYGKGFTENSRTQKFDSRPFSPLMAPFGFMSREWFNKLGGLDKNFSAGQWENDLVLRAMQDGGCVRIVKEAEVWVDHFGKHGGIPGTNFSKGYLTGRKYLESCWIKDGKLSKKRLKPVEPFTW